MKGNNCEREYRTFLMSLKKSEGERERASERKIIIKLQLLQMRI